MAMFSFFRVISLCCILADSASATHLTDWHHTQPAKFTEDTILLYTDTEGAWHSHLITVPSLPGEVPWVCYQTVEERGKSTAQCFYIQENDGVDIREIVIDLVKT
jgi:hypothetical protein